MLLRAAIAYEGRSIPVYEAIYTIKQYNSPRIQVQFLKELKTILPGQCCLIIVNDAGFRGPWFKAVDKLGWYWVVRFRKSTKYRLVSRFQLQPTTNLYARASNKAICLGAAEVSRRNPYPCFLHLFKKRKGKHHNERSVMHAIRHSNSDVFRAQQREPWL